MEVSDRMGVDSTQSGQVVGAEILEATKFLSELFQKTISKEQVGRVLCKCAQGDSLYLDFELGKERAKFALPRPCASPVLSA